MKVLLEHGIEGEMTMKDEKSLTRLEFYQSLADEYAKTPRGYCVAPIALTNFNFKRGEMAFYLILLERLCSNLPSIVRDVPILTLSLETIAELTDCSPLEAQSMLNDLALRMGLISVKSEDNQLFKITLYDVTQVIALREGA